MVDELMAQYGRIDVLVNNVGGTKIGDLGTMSEEAWDAQIRLNLKTVFLSCNAVLPVMAKQESGAVPRSRVCGTLGSPKWRTRLPRLRLSTSLRSLASCMPIGVSE